MADKSTIDVYDARADDYARLVGSEEPSADLVDFVAALPPGGRVLDLGCGPGTASAHMRTAGLRPDPVDASAAMVALANRRFPGVAARIGTFDDIAGKEVYDGVWASFSLLHAPAEDLPRHLLAIARALRPSGRFYIAMKTGTGARRDAIGRLYNFVTVAELHRLLAAAGLSLLSTRQGADKGLAGTTDPFVACVAEKAFV